MTRLKYIFVHGLSGWGSYDEKYQKTPYWGMHSGDHMWPQGGLMRRHDVRPFYLELLTMIRQLP